MVGLMDYLGLALVSLCLTSNKMGQPLCMMAGSAVRAQSGPVCSGSAQLAFYIVLTSPACRPAGTRRIKLLNCKIAHKQIRYFMIIKLELALLEKY